MYTFNQGYTSGLPPAVGNGSGISLSKDAKINLSVIDKYGLPVTSRTQYGGANNLYFDVDVRYLNGALAPSGRNFETGVIGPSYTFSYEKNLAAFSGIPRREYSLVFKLRETSPPTTNSSGKFNIYHNIAEISGFSVDDGTGVSPLTGRIDLNVSLLNYQYYNVSKFEIYSGASSSFTPVTGTGAGANMLKSISIFEKKDTHTLSIYEGEQPSSGFYFYKIIPYDSFGSGVATTTPASGTMLSLSQSPQLITNLTGQAVVLLNEGMYCIQTLHTGSITGSSYQILDTVANISGNIVTGNFYNGNLDSSVGQQETYPFRTIKYTAQITDASGVCSSREILITDNTLSNVSGVSGLHVAEYAVSDQDHGANILVSGQGTGSSDYTRGTGFIYLMAQLSRPNGSYKLLRTIL